MNWYILLLIIGIFTIITVFDLMAQYEVHDELEKGCNSFGDFIISIKDDTNGQHKHATAHYVSECIIPN